MIRNIERAVIYGTYGFFIILAIVFGVRAFGWEMKHEYKTPLTKPCAACLIKFAECMEDVDKYFDKAEDADPKDYVSGKVRCAEFGADCTEKNKCGTRIVMDEDKK